MIGIHHILESSTLHNAPAAPAPERVGLIRRGDRVRCCNPLTGGMFYGTYYTTVYKRDVYGIRIFGTWQTVEVHRRDILAARRAQPIMINPPKTKWAF